MNELILMQVERNYGKLLIIKEPRQRKIKTLKRLDDIALGLLEFILILENMFRMEIK